MRIFFHVQLFKWNFPILFVVHAIIEYNFLNSHYLSFVLKVFLIVLVEFNLCKILVQKCKNHLLGRLQLLLLKTISIIFMCICVSLKKKDAATACDVRFCRDLNYIVVTFSVKRTCNVR